MGGGEGAGEKERKKERKVRCSCTFFEKISNSFDKDISATIIFIAFKLYKVSF